MDYKSDFNAGSQGVIIDQNNTNHKDSQNSQQNNDGNKGVDIFARQKSHMYSV